MGGTHEEMIGPPKAKVHIKPSKAKKKKGKQKDLPLNDQKDIVIHIDSGEVHFHDRKQNLKVAVPKHEFFSAWSRLETLQSEVWRHLDRKNGAVVTVSVKMGATKIAAHVSVEAASAVVADPTFESLQKVASGAKL